SRATGAAGAVSQASDAPTRAGPSRAYLRRSASTGVIVPTELIEGSTRLAARVVEARVRHRALYVSWRNKRSITCGAAGPIRARGVLPSGRCGGCLVGPYSHGR